jgi:hypothetical protein
MAASGAFSAHLLFLFVANVSAKACSPSLRLGRDQNRALFPFVMVSEESRLQPVGVCVMPLRSMVNDEPGQAFAGAISFSNQFVN